MASVAALDSQIFFDPFAAASPKPASGDVFARPGNLPVASVGGPQKPQPDVHDSRAGASQDNAFLISDDDKSDEGEVDEGEADDSRSDAYFPPIEELLRSARREDAKSNSVADRGRNVAPGASDNGNLEWPSLADDTSPSDEDAQSQQPQTCSPERSPAPASLPAGRPFRETGQAPPPEDPVPRASPPGVEARQTPGPPPSPLRLDEATDQEGTPRRDSAGGSDGHGEAEPNPRTATLRPGFRRFRRMPSGGPEDKDEAEAVRKPRHRRRRQHDGEGTRGDDMYHPASETDLDNESSDAGSPPPKRRKRGSWPTPLASATGRQIGLDDGASRPRPARTRASDEKATSQANATVSPSSPGSSDDDEGASDVPMADYQEWPVRDAVLKLITVNGVSTFQLQFRVVESSGSCKKHRRRQSPVTKRPSAKRGKATRVRFAREEDEFLIDLKGQGLSWNEIHTKYEAAFPQRKRSWQTLQSRFSTKLKCLLLSEEGNDGHEQRDEANP